MAESEDRRNEFVESVVRFIIHFNFDGFDINWEYPTERYFSIHSIFLTWLFFYWIVLLSGGIADDRENYTLLLELLHKELSKRGRILSGAVPANLYTINKAYELEEMCKLVDFLWY